MSRLISQAISGCHVLSFDALVQLTAMLVFPGCVCGWSGRHENECTKHNYRGYVFSLYMRI